MIRFITLAFLVAALTVSGAIGLTGFGEETSTEPQTSAPSATSVSAELPTGSDLDSLAASLQSRLGRLPQDSTAWATLGLVYIEQARTSGDASLYAKAEQAVAQSRRADETGPDLGPNPAADAAAATLANARHDFDEALALATSALDVAPYQPTALNARIDALTELGRYDDQLEALEDADAKRPGPTVMTRYSYAFELRGDLRLAEKLLSRVAQGSSSDDDSFALTQAAELARKQGRLGKAAGMLDEAMRQAPGNVAALASKARLAVARDDLISARALWESVVARSPLPDYLTELGELYLFLDEPELAQGQFDVVEATIALLEANDVGADLELALFNADHGEAAKALSTAESEYERRTSVHVADAYGWALFVSGRAREGLTYAKKATALGAPEARFWVHRGLIEAELGKAAARSSLRTALNTDAGLNPWQAERVRSALAALSPAR